jgi:fatty-acyl-CoA synthase
MRNIVDIEAFESKSWQDQCLAISTYDLFTRSARLYANKPALKFQYSADLSETPLIVSHSELLGKINQAANAFFDAGVVAGGVVSLILPNLPQTHYSIWGAETLGIAGPINPLLEPIALRDIMRESGTEALVVLGPCTESGMWEKALGIVDQVPTLKVIFQVTMSRDSSQNTAYTEGGIPILNFDNFLQNQPKEKLLFTREINGDDIAAYFHTGGTTGTPKLAQHSHRNQVFLASIVSAMFGYDESTVALSGLPLFHVNSVFVTGLNVFCRGGHAVFLTPNGYRTPGLIRNLWAFVEKYQATFFSTVPTIVSALLQAAPANTESISSLKYIICGAAPISAETLRQFEKTTGVKILEGYGMTEGTCISSVNPEHGDKRPGSIGLRIPYQSMKCVVFDEEGNYLRDCKIDEQGVLLISGPNVFAGYKQADKNKNVFVDDWFITGDLAREDANGYFWLTGRTKDLIIRGGHNIDPKGIEDVLSNYPAVEQVAAIGQPDAYAGELPCAYVTLKNGMRASIEELLVYAKQHVAERASVPVYIEVIDTMPVTAVGKIFKPTLRARAISRVFTETILMSGNVIAVEVDPEEKRGMVARIDISSVDSNDRKTIKGLLKPFTIAVEFKE